MKNWKTLGNNNNKSNRITENKKSLPRLKKIITITRTEILTKWKLYLLLTIFNETYMKLILKNVFKIKLKDIINQCLTFQKVKWEVIKWGTARSQKHRKFFFFNRFKSLLIQIDQETMTNLPLLHPSILRNCFEKLNFFLGFR